MSTSAASLPGFHSPAASFDEPFEMLCACHDRVRRSLALLGRLVEHVQRNGHDQASRSAAADVLRYFDLAGPHHHEDEERHVFPPLRGHSDARVREAVAQLQDDHVQMHAMWAQLRRVLAEWRDAPEPAPPTSAQCRLAADFAAAYERHIPLEESVVYPAAQGVLDEAALHTIGEEMAARRRQKK